MQAFAPLTSDMNKQLLFQLQKETFWVTLNAVLESAISTQKLSFVDFLLARAKVFLISILNMDHLPSPSLLPGNSAEGTNRRWSCWVLPGLSKYASNGKVRKADSGNGKSEMAKLFCNTSVSSLQWALVSTLFSHTHFRAFLVVMADVIKQINTTIPALKTVSFRQDSAGCYHCRACRATIVCAGVLGAELGREGSLRRQGRRRLSRIHLSS